MDSEDVSAMSALTRLTRLRVSMNSFHHIHFLSCMPQLLDLDIYFDEYDEPVDVECIISTLKTCIQLKHLKLCSSLRLDTQQLSTCLQRMSRLTSLSFYADNLTSMSWAHTSTLSCTLKELTMRHIDTKNMPIREMFHIYSFKCLDKLAIHAAFSFPYESVKSFMSIMRSMYTVPNVHMPSLRTLTIG